MSPPDPSAPPPSSTSPPIQRDPGLTLGNNGIPVPPPHHQPKRKTIQMKSLGLKQSSEHLVEE